MDVLLDIGRLDLLIKQKADQIQFLFSQQPSDEAPAIKISDLRARALWINAFGAQARMVPWKDFLSVYLAASGEPNVHDPDLVTLNQFIDFTLDGWVSTFEFEVFMLSFGPIMGSATRLLSPFNSGILAGYTPSAEANALLNGKDPGCYLIRFSKSNPGSFAVTFVDSKGRIKHCLLYNAKPNGMTLRQPPDVFPTLEAFVKAHSARLKTPLGASAQRSRALEIAGVSGSAYSQSLVGDPSSFDAYTLDGIEPMDVETDEKMCVVCMAAPVGSCFIPCGHACCCLACGKKLEVMKERRCPVCRSEVSTTQQIFLV